MTIRIKQDIYHNIIGHTRKELPIEACGYLAGKNGVITRYFAMKNIDNSPEHFSFDPAEQFEVIKTARNEGLDIISNYHSHPETPARPSVEDIRLAFDPNIFYLIISLATEEASVKAFKIENKIVTNIDIIVED